MIARQPLLLIVFSFIIRLIGICTISLIAEEAYYWNYANHLDFGYLDHPPMVGALIKISTLLLGHNELGVRFSSLLCWGIGAYFSYQLTERIAHKRGLNALFLFSILPFFFLHSLVITPDLPLIAAWSACLFYLYLALIENQKNAWIWFGVWFGLGMLAKYTIVLIAPAVLIFLIITHQWRRTLRSFYPYVAAIISLLIFSPVVYWNATHEWASFLFQSTRRFQAIDHSSFIEFVGLLVFFLTPLGLISLWTLFNKNHAINMHAPLSVSQRRFIQCFTLTPLCFFAGFSIVHTIKFNWIGPALLAIIPWIASIQSPRLKRAWLIMGCALLFGYTLVITAIVTSHPKILYRSFLTKYVDWRDFNHQVYDIAEKGHQRWQKPVVLLPIDRYGLASELTYYQMRAHHKNGRQHVFPVIGSDRLGYEALMYHFWSKNIPVNQSITLLIAEDANIFRQPFIQAKVRSISPIEKFWSHSQGAAIPVIPYYYQFVRFRESSR